MDVERLNRLKSQILASDDRACFIERENILAENRESISALPESLRYTAEFELLMKNLSTPIDPDDVFAGRMVEGIRSSAPLPPLPGQLSSDGHITLPMEKILTLGFAGIAAEVDVNAERVNSPEARYFQEQTRRCVQAIKEFCDRYGDAAEKAGKAELARACRTVPYLPAYDLFSALQSVWMTQFIFSAVIGARDFAPGRLDLILERFCSGERAQMVELFAYFCLKFNEITGLCTSNYALKPIPCVSTKQYITLGPEFNSVAEMFVEAAALVRMPQPTFNFRLRNDFPLAGRAAHLLGPQSNFFNDRLISNKLLNSGFPPEVAENFSFTACNRVDLPGVLHNKMCHIDIFDNTTAWFREALFAVSSAEDILPELRRLAYGKIVNDIREKRRPRITPYWSFHLESIGLQSCIRSCRDIERGGADHCRWMHRMFSGIGTMADSLVAVRHLLKQFSYGEILQILESDFEGREVLRQEIRKHLPKFGNGEPEADRAAADISNCLIDAFEDAAIQEGFIPMPSLYSLYHQHPFGRSIGATPDGRKAGAAISENQSPSPGMDRNGPTMLLKSVASLPLDRCICGGLNLKFPVRPAAETFEALLRSFFEMGGQHLGFTVVEKETLEDARRNPEKHQTLYVRVTGFSEYFTALSPEQQQEMIDRTELR